MWIIPRQLITSHFAPGTKALGLDCEEFGEMSEKSLMWRSKPSLKRTWCQRWKRVTYIQRLSTRILKPSHSGSFLEKWIYSVPVFLASRLVLPVDETQLMIRDIYTHTSLKESLPVDQLTLFSKMSKESSQAKPQTESRYSNMSSETWKKEVISARGEYSARLKLVRPINEKESLSWPTAKLSDGEGGRIKPTELSEGGFRSLRKKSNQWFGSKLRDAVETHEEKNWPTPTLAESSGGKRTKQIKEGKWHNIQLREAIDLENEKNWPTPTSTVRSGINPKTGKGEGLSKQAKNWATPNTMDHLPPKEGEAQERIFRTHRKGRTEPCNLREQVNPKSWPTPTSRDHKDTPGMSFDRKDRKGGRIDCLPRKVYCDGLPDQDKSSTSGKNPGRLNPNWVEQVMGLPFVGWTQLPTEWTG